MRMAYDNVKTVYGANYLLLRQFWQELQQARTRVRERDLAPTMLYTINSPDTTGFATSVEDTEFDSLIQKVEEAMNELTKGQESNE